jgi:hypothetical protein
MSNSPIKSALKKYFVSSFINNAELRDNLFFFIGKTTGWGESGPTAGTPEDTVIDDIDIMRNIIAYKAIQPSDINYMIPKNEWTYGAKYDEYSDSVSLDDKIYHVMTDEYHVYKCISNNDGGESVRKPTSTVTTGTFSTSDGYRWKYLFTVPEMLRKYITADYIPVPIVSFRSFDDITQRQYDTQRNAINGSIDYIRVTSSKTVNITNLSYSGLFQNGNPNTNTFAAPYAAGVSVVKFASGIGSSNFTNCDLNVVSGPGAGQLRRIVSYNVSTKEATLNAPLTQLVTDDSIFHITPGIVINGDGQNAQAYISLLAYDASNPSVVIREVVVTNPGKNYTYATITNTAFNNGYNSQPDIPKFAAVLPPFGGHGVNPLLELDATKLFILVRFEGTEGITGLDIRNDILQYGIVLNPKLNDTDPQYLDNLGNPIRVANVNETTVRDIIVESNTNTPLPQNLFTPNRYVIGSDSKATAQIVSFLPTNETGFGLLKVKNIQGEFRLPLNLGFTGEPLVEFNKVGNVWTFDKVEKARIVTVLDNPRNTTDVVFDGTTVLGVSGAPNILDDTVVVGSSSDAYGTVLGWDQGLTNGNLILTDVHGLFVSGEQIDISGGAKNVASIDTITIPEIKPVTGQVLYAQNMKPIVRGPEQLEEFQILLGF